MSQETFNLLEWSESSLEYWFRLAEVHNTYGMPVDLIWVMCDQRNRLPKMIQKITDMHGTACFTVRPVTSDEFEAGIKDCIKILQSGGLQKFLARAMETSANVRCE